MTGRLNIMCWMNSWAVDWLGVSADAEWQPPLYHHVVVTLLLTGVWLPGFLVDWLGYWECLQTRVMATSVPPSLCDLVVDRCMVTWHSGWLTQWLGVPADQSDGHICSTVCMWPCCWQVYGYLAFWLTDWECLRTQSEYDNSITIKLFLLQFVNYFSSIVYIAFFKGRSGRSVSI